MSKYVNFNGDIITKEQPIFNGKNRGFRYGDGLFETIRVFDGKAPFVVKHFERLKKGLSLLKFEIPEFYSESFFCDEIEKLTEGIGNHRIRLSVFRSEGGFYTPTDNHPNFLIEDQILDNSGFKLNEKGLAIGIFEDLKISNNLLSSLKTANSLSYILAGIYCKENN